MAYFEYKYFLTKRLPQPPPAVPASSTTSTTLTIKLHQRVNRDGQDPHRALNFSYSISMLILVMILILTSIAVMRAKIQFTYSKIDTHHTKASAYSAATRPFWRSKT